MTPEHRITPTVPAETEALASVADATGLFPGELLAPMLAKAEEERAQWLTLAVSDAPVGLCYLIPEALAEGVWNMRALAVHPDMQGRGLGTAFVAAAETELSAGGARLVVVNTSGADTFAATRRFYAANGYEEEARIRDFWGVGDDKVTFRKLLML